TNRYKNPHWTFGRNPLGTFCSSHRFPIGTIELSIEIAKGKISQCHFGGDYLTTMDLEPIAQCLTGTWFQEEDIAKVLDDYEIEKILKITHRKEFIDFILGRSSTCISLN
ncbi:MAG: hypothetical protein IKU44_04870, partial [Firmicutes bacterium]|nr:hypothetical protein [Bacillota bacterium]